MDIFLLFMISFCCFSSFSFTEASPEFKKCEACRVVADAFLGRLSSERIRNHLDMRHRLDKNGKRYGKVISYNRGLVMCRVSELRASEILDDLCEDMAYYGLAKPAVSEDEAEAAPAGTADWAWVLKGGDSYINQEQLKGDEAKAMNKRLRNYCYGVIERTEDALAKYLASDATHHEGLDEFLCEQLVEHCEPSEDSAADGSTAGGSTGTEAREEL